MGELREPQFTSQKESEKPELLEDEEDEKFIEAYFKRREEERGMIERNKEEAEDKGKGGLYRKISECLAGLTMLGMVNAASAEAGFSFGEILNKVTGGILDPGNIVRRVEDAITSTSNAEVKDSVDSSQEKREMGTVVVEIERVDGGGGTEIRLGIQRALKKAGYTVIHPRKGEVGVDMALKVNAIETRNTRDSGSFAEKTFGVRARWLEVEVQLETELIGTRSGEVIQSTGIEGTARSLEDIQIHGEDIEWERRTWRDLDIKAAEAAMKLLLPEMKKMNSPQKTSFPPPYQPDVAPQQQTQTPRAGKQSEGDVTHEQFRKELNYILKKVAKDFASGQPDMDAFELFSPERRDLYADEYNYIEDHSDYKTGFYFERRSDGRWDLRKRSSPSQPNIAPQKLTPVPRGGEKKEKILTPEEKIEKFKQNVQRDYLNGKPAEIDVFKQFSSYERKLYVEEWNRLEAIHHKNGRLFRKNPKGGWLY